MIISIVKDKLKAVTLLLFLQIFETTTAAPILYDDPFNGSPVSVVRGEILTLSGYGFTKSNQVVYKRIDDDGSKPERPLKIPRSNSDSEGVIPVISQSPETLTLTWPNEVLNKHNYAIWVVDGDNSWSNPVLVNDMRPLWFSPSFVYETQARGLETRYLKVIGRNLSQPGLTKRHLKLINLDTASVEYLLTTDFAEDEQSLLNEYVLKVALPSKLHAGRYIVSISKDGAELGFVE